MKQMETKPKEIYEKPSVQDIRPVATVAGFDGDSQYNDANDGGDD
jgi:hypothetical protein